jgi:hypothetical protein
MSWHPPATCAGVARLPRGAAARGVTRLRAWVHQLELDAALAAGADPWTDPQLLVRATQLSSVVHRRRLARGLRSSVELAAAGQHVFAPVRLRRRAVLAERDRLYELAAAVDASGPVPVAVLARLMSLLTDPSSPIFVGGAPPEGLRRAVDVSCAALAASADRAS